MQTVNKVIVTTPETHTDAIIKAMSRAGAGIIGKYTHCATITKTIGNYMPETGAKPFIGKVGEMSREPEDKIEMICPKDKLDNVIKAILETHPYESPTIDVYDIKFYSRQKNAKT